MRYLTKIEWVLEDLEKGSKHDLEDIQKLIASVAPSLEWLEGVYNRAKENGLTRGFDSPAAAASTSSTPEAET